MKRLTVVLAAVVAAMTMGSGVAWAQKHGGYHGGGGGHGYGGHGYSGHAAHQGGHYGYRGGYGTSLGIYIGDPWYWAWPGYAPGFYAYDPYIPPAVYVSPAAPADPVIEALPAPANYWYYCSNPAGYYPYVQNCTGPWTKVSPTPPPSSSPPAN